MPVLAKRCWSGAAGQPGRRTDGPHALDAAWAGCPPPAPHHPLVLGAGVAAAGGRPELAARAAALATCTGPASAAVRLLGLDPFAVQGLLARLAPEIGALAAEADAAASRAGGLSEPDEAGDPDEAGGEQDACGRRHAGALGGFGDLPADSAPALELLADFHLTAEVRLFAS
ncbi:MAG: urease accessory UreF family protein [Streptosporangiaceae bacterium]